MSSRTVPSVIPVSDLRDGDTYQTMHRDPEGGPWITGGVPYIYPGIPSYLPHTVLLLDEKPVAKEYPWPIIDENVIIIRKGQVGSTCLDDGSIAIRDENGNYVVRRPDGLTIEAEFVDSRHRIDEWEPAVVLPKHLVDSLRASSTTWSLTEIGSVDERNAGAGMYERIDDINTYLEGDK